MTRVVLSPEAQGDSDEILSSLARDAGPRVAARYARSFDRLYAFLADHPTFCPARLLLGERVRTGVVAPYLAFHGHDAASATLYMLRIVLGRRRITPDLPRRGSMSPHRSS